MTAIKSMTDLRPGDIFLGPIGGALGAGIRAAQVIVDGGWRVGPLHVEHIGIVTRASEYHQGPTVYDGETDSYGPLTMAPGPLDSFDAAERAGYVVYPTGVITAPLMVQAMPHGAEEIEMSASKHWTPRCAYARIPEDYPGQAHDAAEAAQLMVERGVAYSFASYAALAAYRWHVPSSRLTEWIGRRQEPTQLDVSGGRNVILRLPVEAICSVLVDQAWSLAGKRVMEGAAYQAVTPSMLGQRLLTGMEDVVWAWPRK